MASEVGIKLVVGATLAGSFHAVLGGAKKTVADLAGAVDAAIAQGETLAQFRKRFKQM